MNHVFVDLLAEQSWFYLVLAPPKKGH